MAIKQILEPDNAEELLRGWLLHSHKSRDRHNFAARKYDKWRYLIGIPATVLSAIVGTAIFATLSQGEPTLSQWESGFLIKIFVGFLAVFAAVLTSLQAFLDLGSYAEKHRLAGVRYKAIIRELEQMGIGNKAELSLDDPLLTELRKRLDALEEESPVIPPRVYQTIETKYKEKSFVDSVLEPQKLLKKKE